MRLHARVGGRVFAADLERSGDRLRATLDGRGLEVRLDDGDGPLRTLLVGDRRVSFGWSRSNGTYAIVIDGRPHEVAVVDARTEQLARAAGSRSASGTRAEVRAPIPGLISKVLLKAGDRVDRHQTVCCLDAMKLENEIASPREGVLRELAVSPGQPVEKGQILFVVE